MTGHDAGWNFWSSSAYLWLWLFFIKSFSILVIRCKDVILCPEKILENLNDSFEIICLISLGRTENKLFFRLASLISIRESAILFWIFRYMRTESMEITSGPGLLEKPLNSRRNKEGRRKYSFIWNYYMNLLLNLNAIRSAYRGGAGW